MDSPGEIAQRYLGSTPFLLDLLGVLPFDLLGFAACAALGAPVPTWVPLLKLLHMVRSARCALCMA